jgi:hypothetical protein
MKAERLDSPPPWFNSSLSQAGWIQKDGFKQTFKQFSCCEGSKRDPIILTLDGHYYHSRNIDVIECSPENGVHTVCLPPHNTHKVQSL